MFAPIGSHVNKNRQNLENAPFQKLEKMCARMAHWKQQLSLKDIHTIPSGIIATRAMDNIHQTNPHTMTSPDRQNCYSLEKESP